MFFSASGESDHVQDFTARSGCDHRGLDLAARRGLCRRRAQGDSHRLGDLQSGVDDPQAKGLAGEGIRQGRHQRRLGAVGRFQQGARIPQRRLDRFRIDRGLGGAGRQDQRQSDQVDLCLFAPRMDRAGDSQGFQDRLRRRSQGQARRGDARHRSAHLPGARAARRRPHRKGHHAGAAAARRRQDRADPRRRRCLGRSRSDDGAGRSRGGRKAVLPQGGRQHLGHPQCARAVPEGPSGRRSPRARGLRGGAQIFAGQLRRPEEDLHRRDQAAGGGGRQAAQGAHRADPQPHRRSRSATPSSPPASRCSRPASSTPRSTSRRRWMR